MKIISTSNDYIIYGDDLKAYDKLPTQTYVVNFSKMSGFSIKKRENLECNEEKIYGVHLGKISKAIKAFNTFNRNLGIILSGDKGIGKSLFAKLLAAEALKNDIPVIIVDTYYPGIASFIESIEQEVMVLFDEFDKTFTKQIVEAEMLTLFDGISTGKKLFAVTCNDMYKISDFLVNRPGRFHYHFRFEYPTPEEVREYLNDKVAENKGEIEKVVNFSRSINLNYDCLRAIAFELNMGNTFAEAISDLNITNTTRCNYDVTVVYESGEEFTNTINMNPYSTDTIGLDLYKNGKYVKHIIFTAKEIKYSNDDIIMIPAIERCEDDWEEEDNDNTNSDTVKYIIARKCKQKSIHYCL